MSVTSSKKALIGGWVISGLLSLFLIMDALMKLAQLDMVIEKSAELGIGAKTVFALGAILLASTILYVIPRTAAIGATLLCAYLGGAIMAHVFIHDVPFTLAFPAILGVLLWVGLLLRDRRLRVLLPWA